MNRREIERAEMICRAKGVRLTDQRKRVLAIVNDQARPMGAYEILEQLEKTVAGAKPPTVYRALAFLQRQGLVHRIESLNAFVGCVHPEHPHVVQFLICRQCGLVQELEDKSVQHILESVVRDSGFEAESQVVEVTGRCSGCCTKFPENG